MADTSDNSTLTTSIELYGPSGGDAIAADSNGYVSVIALTIDESGTYTLLAKGAGSYNATTGTYDIYFVRMPGANELGLLYNDETIPEIIDLGDLDTYTFIANVGETFDIQVSDTSETGNLRLRIELYGPSGGNYLRYDNSADVASVSHTPTQIGTYVVLVKDVSSYLAATGEYEISCVTDGDNDIDGEDLYEFVGDYINMNSPYADKNADGAVDEDDVAKFAQEYGKY